MYVSDLSTVDPPLEVEELSLQIAGLRILNDVSFTLGSGEALAVIGPNGAGKTTLFNCITGQMRPSSGRITSNGIALLGKRPSRIAALGVARTYQNLALFSSMTVRQNLMLGYHRAMKADLAMSGLAPRRTRSEEAEYVLRVEEIISSLALEPYSDQSVSVLPQGILKKVELARAVAMNPQLLLMDEPAAGMNSEETEDFSRYIKRLHESNGMSIVLVEHDIPFVMHIAQRIIVLNFGELIASGTPMEVLQDPRVIEAYLGKTAS